VLAGDEEDDVADLALGEVAGELRERVRADMLVLGQLGRERKRRTLGIAEQRARPKGAERVELGGISSPTRNESPGST
jgi:hypothetical protein